MKTLPLALTILLAHAAAPLQHGGKTYKTVKIGTQTWMAENLNQEAEGSVCYENTYWYYYSKSILLSVRCLQDR